MKTAPNDPEALTALPNIGREVARLLVAAGIRTPLALRRLGAVAAARRIRNVRPDDPPCRSMLAGLEGAIRGVRWITIPRAEREALWQAYIAPPGNAPRSTRPARPAPRAPQGSNSNAPMSGAAPA